MEENIEDNISEHIVPAGRVFGFYTRGALSG